MASEKSDLRGKSPPWVIWATVIVGGVLLAAFSYLAVLLYYL